MKVLVTVTSLLPDYGGPAFSVARLAIALADTGAEVGLWASDQSAMVTPLIPDGSCVQRILGTEAEALRSFGNPDVLHDNGIWLPHNHRLSVLAERRGVPRVVSTRGMLEPWSLRHKRFKKRVAWNLYQRRDLKHAMCHHATAESEARHLQHLRLGVPIVTVPNGVDVPEERPSLACLETEQRVPDRRRTALYLGRIHPIKGLPMLIRAWARVQPKDWCLRIAGPDEADHRKELEKAVLDAGLGEVISFTGPIEHRRKNSVFFNADLFVLPSHSESFGMVVAEALAHGLPVLATTGSPWSILTESGCGWWVDATVDGIEEGLREATAKDPATLRAMGRKGRALVTAEFCWQRIADRVLSMYGVTLGKSEHSAQELTSPLTRLT